MIMNQRLLLLTLFLGFHLSYSQELKHEKYLGFSYGFGSAIVFIDWRVDQKPGLLTVRCLVEHYPGRGDG